MKDLGILVREMGLHEDASFNGIRSNCLSAIS
jgi:hypothetical protein